MRKYLVNRYRIVESEDTTYEWYIVEIKPWYSRKWTRYGTNLHDTVEEAQEHVDKYILKLPQAKKVYKQGQY